MRRPRVTPLRVALALAAASLAGVGVAYAAGVTVTSGQLWAGTQTLTKGPCTPAGSDATIDQNNAGANYGNLTTFNAYIHNGNKTRYALLQFDLGSCGIPTSGGADSATLKITVTGASGDTISAYPITSSWNAGTVTWNTAPTVGATPDFTFTGNAGTQTITVTAALDAAIKSGAFYGWELRDTSGGNGSLTTFSGSAGGTSPPSLTVNYEY